MNIALIYNEKKVGTGAHYINDLIAAKLKHAGTVVKNFYPKVSLDAVPPHLAGIKNILFFFSLLERRKEILKYQLIQGTTYTPLPFLAYPVPVITHCGSTTRGFLNATPLAAKLEPETRKIWYTLRKDNVLDELNLKTRRPLRDIADIEEYVADRAAAVIATSEKVRGELVGAGIAREKIHLIHNVIEDYWFEYAAETVDACEKPSIVFLGRMGANAFTLKLKGVDRLIGLYQRFPETPKRTFCISTNKSLMEWLRTRVREHRVYANIKKDLLPDLLRPLYGSVLFIPSRYEGFSLSLIEGMSQGLIPVAYDVGVVPEVIVQGENGYIVRSQTEAFRWAQELLTNRPLRQRLAANARRTALRFRSETIVSPLIQLYKTILGQ